ncbi:MAG: fused MFS/spermidine synthase [Bacteroidia bacterium]
MMPQKGNGFDVKNLLLLVFFGVVSGCAFTLNILALAFHQGLSSIKLGGWMAFGSVLFIFLFLVTRKIILWLVFRSTLPDEVKNKFSKYHTFTYSVFFLLLSGAVGIKLELLPIIAGLLFLLVQALLIYFLMNNQHKEKLFLSLEWLAFLFLISGFAAIIYQIVWQKVLFASFGVNIESVTIVVSIFMFGLGTGSIIGGILSKKYPAHLPNLFFICEVLIGIFGIASIPLIKIVSSMIVQGSLFEIGLSIGGLLIIPTILMGATLPILVTYLHRHYQNIGKSVGFLYCVNTIGSAIACFITAKILFSFFGKQTAVIFAACCNLAAGWLVYKYTQRLKKSQQSTVNSQQSIVNRQQSTDGKLTTDIPQNQLKFFIVLVLSVMTGYISLSQEILWFRVVSYTTGGMPSVFAYVLGTFLFGVAFSSYAVKRVCEKGKIHPVTLIALMLFLSSIVYYISIPFTGFVISHSIILGMFSIFGAVGLISFLIGGIFPLLCHFGITKNKSVGIYLSWIYFANIIGATAGPLLTGFVLMNYFTLEKNVQIICILTLILAAVVSISSPASIRIKSAMVISVALTVAMLFLIQPYAFADILEKLQYKQQFFKKAPFKYSVQNRNGIVTVGQGTEHTYHNDIVYGGGYYDGKFNLDPVSNSNRIRRAYMISALHRNPEEVLVIGLASGSWTRVVGDYPMVKKIAIIEINPGYLKIIPSYPHIASILNDPRSTVYIDDGRRWLSRNPDKKFDFIMINNTFHWRDGSTNLLSVEFLKMCRNHLKDGGVIYFNSTGCEDILFTAAQVFSHVTNVGSFVAASDVPFDQTEDEKRANLLKFHRDGAPVFSTDSANVHVLVNLVRRDLKDKADQLRSRTDLISVSDDNMATEYKTGVRRVYQPKNSWGRIFNK